MNRRLGDYEILDQLGEGGMGAVFRARHERLGREVALKVLRPGVVVTQEHERRFQREMTLAAGLSHPNLVKILDGGALEGTAFIAMELVDGLTVTRLVNQWAPLPWPVALAIASRVADGLAFLHERSILHRDIKPSNILVSREGYVKLLDFGLARGHGSTVMTQEGAVVGTLQYLAPEVLTGEDATVGTDLWATGVVLYLMLAGRMHVTAQEFNEWVSAIVNDPIPSPGSIVPSIPAPVSQLVTRMLARDPAQRVRKAASLRDELERQLEMLAETSWDRVLVPGLITSLERGAYQLPAPSAARRTAVLESVDPTPTSPTAPATRHRPRSRAATGAAPRPRGRYPLLLAIPVLLASTLIAFAVLRPLAPRPDPLPSATLSAALSPAGPTAAMPVADLDPRIKSAFARKLTPYLPRLKQGGPTAKRNVEELANISPLSFGKAPDRWIHWIEFEQWIGSGGRGRPPVFPGTEPGQLDYLEERMALSWLAKLGSELTPQLIVSVYRGVGGAPDDWRCWMAMGRVFEMEGRSQDARICYERGLEKLNLADMPSAPDLVWVALARALQVVPGRDLEREWFRFLPPVECRRAWVGLKAALGGDTERLERLLKLGLAQPLQRDMASVMLGQVLVEASGDTAKAWRIWNEALDAQPDLKNAREVIAAMFAYLCERGHLEEARALMRRTKKDYWGPAIDYLAGVPKELAWRAHREDAGIRLLYLRLEAFRQLELKAVAEAEALADVLAGDSHVIVRGMAPLLVELVGQGTTRPWIESELTRLLAVDPPDLSIWNDAAGGLAGPAGLRLMDRWLTPAGQQTEDWREMMRAVWLSRRGKHAQALDALQASIDRYGTNFVPGNELTEVLARPLLEDRLGPPQDAAVLKRARAFPIPALLQKTIVGVYLDALRAGQMDLARDHCRNQFEVSPRAFFWPLAWTLHARIAGRTEDARVARARLASAVRWHGCGLWALAAGSR